VFGSYLRKTFPKGGINLSTNIIMFSLSSTLATSYVTPYPSNRLNKATNYKTLYDTTLLPYNKMYNGCSSNLCYTTSKGTFIYKPHTDVGQVGRTSAGYLAQRKRM
jgi:hypothetical protein